MPRSCDNRQNHEDTKQTPLTMEGHEIVVESSRNTKDVGPKVKSLQSFFMRVQFDCSLISSNVCPEDEENYNLSVRDRDNLLLGT